MKKKVYVSIPITGKEYKEQYNHAFNVKVLLEMKNMEPVSPFDLVKDPHTPYSECMGHCIQALLDCDTIYMCKGWNQSKGCMAELQIALIYNKEIIIE